MELEKNTYDHLLEQALKLGEKAFSPTDEADVFIEGRTNILNEPEFGNISRMRSLFRTFEEKATMVRLLDKCMEPKGVQISIGSENTDSGNRDVQSDHLHLQLQRRGSGCPGGHWTPENELLKDHSIGGLHGETSHGDLGKPVGSITRVPDVAWMTPRS